jgi:hypothetical protein
MGKASKRRGGRQERTLPVGQRHAPATLPETTHPFLESEFVPLRRVPDVVTRSKDYQVFRTLLDHTILVSWSLGRQGTHISSRFEMDDGTIDVLTSANPSDDDYVSLTTAHAGRAIELARSSLSEDGEAGSDDDSDDAGVEVVM